MSVRGHPESLELGGRIRPWGQSLMGILGITEGQHLAMVLEKTLVSPLDCKEIKPVNPKGNQS